MLYAGWLSFALISNIKGATECIKLELSGYYEECSERNESPLSFEIPSPQRTDRLFKKVKRSNGCTFRDAKPSTALGEGFCCIQCARCCLGYRCCLSLRKGGRFTFVWVHKGEDIMVNLPWGAVGEGSSYEASWSITIKMIIIHSSNIVFLLR